MVVEVGEKEGMLSFKFLDIFKIFEDLTVQNSFRNGRGYSFEGYKYISFLSRSVDRDIRFASSRVMISCLHS